MNQTMLMYCDQCEQTFNGVACTTKGVCGKNPDVESLQKTLIYGLKGLCAYKHHARKLGKTDAEIEEFIERAMFSTLTNVNFDMEHLLELVLECGKMNLKTMQLLNDAHVEAFGKPTPVKVKEGIQEGPGILITGHDLYDLKILLEQVKETNIKVYTHGEMLPAHMYPKLREYSNLAGHYGGAWQLQRKEFESFGGPIVVTTNCVLIPASHNTYLDRLFTLNATGVPGAPRIKNDDYSPVIKKALEIGPLKPTDIKESTIGFHWTYILSIADKLIELVKAGKIRHFFVIGGCDGAEPGRNYFSEFAKNTPPDSLILTLGCGKYRIRNYDYGEIEGIPRLLDMGQCNDSYGAIQVALTLAKVFSCGVNDLPLTLVLSWFEQKAVAVLLTLLSLGVKGIRLGPALPAFITPTVFKLLQERFDLQPIGTDPIEDVKSALKRAS